MTLMDNPDRYGQVSRALHWGMAVLLLWQFLSAGAHFLIEDTAVEQFLWATHKPLGFLLFVLVIIRIVWAVINRSNRPPSINIAAKLGHIALYGLMIVVPGLALLRQYGSGKSFEPFGIPLFAEVEGVEATWMIVLGDLLHSWLGWALLAGILVHIFMTFRHKTNQEHTDVLPRMWR